MQRQVLMMVVIGLTIVTLFNWGRSSGWSRGYETGYLAGNAESASVEVEATERTETAPQGELGERPNSDPGYRYSYGYWGHPYAYGYRPFFFPFFLGFGLFKLFFIVFLLMGVGKFFGFGRWRGYGPWGKGWHRETTPLTPHKPETAEKDEGRSPMI